MGIPIQISIMFLTSEQDFLSYVKRIPIGVYIDDKHMFTYLMVIKKFYLRIGEG